MPRPEFVTIARHVYLQILSRLAYLESIYGTTPVTVPMSDPGNGGTLAPTTNGAVSLAIGAGAETSTVLDPIFVGQMLSFTVSSAVGNRTLNFAHAIDKVGNTNVLFNGNRDFLLLIGILVGVNYRWQLVSSESVTLS